jgi:CRISPR type III-B/RAMP module RAMP protein Cmr1
MKVETINIRLRSPIWTGGPDQRPVGLKMSGIMGGLRQSFEMLVRAHGGHTCDCTSEEPKKRCTYETVKQVCPACQIFGCTGLGRAFKLNLNVPDCPVVFPERDKRLPGKMGPTSIDTWLASTVKGLDPMLKPKEHEPARAVIADWRVAYTGEIVGLKLIALRDVPQLALEREENGHIELLLVLRYLLLFHSHFHGLGAKTQQGWGQFSLIDPMSKEEQFAAVDALKRLSASCRPEAIAADEKLPRAEECFYAEWDLGQGEPELGLEFHQGARLAAEYRCTGFALRFRLRRAIVGPDAERPPVALDWNKNIPAEKVKSSNESRKPSEKRVVQRLLFGRDVAGNDDKVGGIIGVSHLYKENGSWRVRLIGRLPAVPKYRTTRGAIALPWNPTAVRTHVIGEFGKCIGKGAPERIVTADKWLHGLEDTER